jgi:acyl-coenzyme A synthetase/AMP-(fatty) acid ligase
MNVAALIQRHGRTRPNAVALIDGARSLTYRELAGLVARSAVHLAHLGATAGDRVGLCLKDTADHIVVLLAVARLGAVAVTLDWRARAAEQARLIAAAGIEFVVAERAFSATAACSTIELDAAWHRAVARAETGGERAGDWHDPFVISASSGSTGAPKLTLMTHLQYHFAVAGMLEVLGLSGRHRYLSTLPLYYSGGRNSCIAHLLRGDCVILLPGPLDAAEYINAARRHQATVGVIVPSMLRRLLAGRVSGKPLLPGFDVLFATGAPLHAEEKREALRGLSPNFRERYGTAETLVVSALRPEDIAERADSVGRPHSLAEVEVVDDDDQALAVGEAGHLRVRGPGIASPLPGSEAAFRNGWFYPGELARLDELRYIFLDGRVSEVIMRSGAKIHPAEVEQALREHPDVIDAAVIGQPDGNHEEIVVAFVAPRREIAPGELIAHCRVRLTAHKVPRQFHFLAQLPRNNAGKIDKLALARACAQRQ